MTRNIFLKNYKDFIQCAIKLNETVKRQGLLSLENEIENLDDENFKQGLRFAIDGIGPEIIDEIYSNIIEFEKDEHLRQLKIIQKRTVLGIQKGENTHILYLVLNSYANLSPEEKDEIESSIFYDTSDEYSDQQETEDLILRSKIYP
ncbi:MAG: hypothetical protein FWC22_08475 [Treponema sp.]|nr:hypothetical protein [Treponema sp.]